MVQRMNEQQRFDATMHYRPRDRAPICDFGFWWETLVEWHKQGLPGSVDRSNSDAFFGADGLERYVISRESSSGSAEVDKGQDCGAGIKVGLFPMFEERVIEDRGEEEVVQQGDGVRVRRRKFMGSIPIHEGHLLVDRESWHKHYRPRLDPSTPDRYPADWERFRPIWRDPDRAYPLFLPGGSLYGWIRNWMGLEALSYVVYDDPAWFEQMVQTLADCIVDVLGRVLETGGRFNGCAMWEDMCFNAGPLLSPAHFRRYLVPQYKRITSLLRKHGVDVVWVDCDGCIDELIPLWLEAGVNCMMPVEVGTWGADPIAYRKEYGKDLLLMGGFNKRILTRSKWEIEREVKRLAPLVEEGGYIGFCDHRVPPDVPLEKYMFYVETIRRVWGKGI